MTSPPNTAQSRILFCNCAHYDIIPAATRERVLHALTSACREAPQIEVVGDLCGLAANRDPRLKSWVEQASLTIVACFPRTIRWLFHAAGVPLPTKIRVINNADPIPSRSSPQLRFRIADCGFRSPRQSAIRNQQSAIRLDPLVSRDRL